MYIPHFGKQTVFWEYTQTITIQHDQCCIGDLAKHSMQIKKRVCLRNSGVMIKLIGQMEKEWKVIEAEGTQN